MSITRRLFCVILSLMLMLSLVPPSSVGVFATDSGGLHTYTIRHFTQTLSLDDYALYDEVQEQGYQDVEVSADSEIIEGFTFDATNPNNVLSGVIVADDSLVLSLYYTRNKYTITFNANGGEGGVATELYYGAVLNAPSVSQAGFAFLYWFPEVPQTVPAFSATYTAQWDPLTYTITFDPNGGTGGYSRTMVAGEELEVPVVLRPGYEFQGWDPAVPAVSPAKDTTYMAQWRRITYDMVFNAAGGTGGVTLQLAYGEPLNPPTVTRPGYVFAGWSPTVPQTVPEENMTFTALWSLALFTITFDANGGVGGTSELRAYNDDLSAPSVWREGHTFAGWSPAVPAKVPMANTVYTAQWTVNSYTITFNANGGSGGTTGTYTYGTPLQAPAVTRPGHTLTGWSPALPQTVPGANTEYFAQWTPTTYTATFDANGGTGGVVRTLAFGATLTAPTVTRVGHTFTGWSPSVPSTMPAENVVFIAQWTKNSYRIIFDPGVEGTGGSNQMLPYGDPLTPPQVTRTGYTLTGWSPAVPATVPAQNTTYVAQWELTKYAIVFDANGGIGGETRMLTAGSTLIPPVVTRDGHSFVKWNPTVPATSPAQNTTYVAEWKINSYRLIFNAAGGSGSTNTMVVYGTVITPPTVQRTGYVFKGWNPQVPATMPGADSTYTAVWEPVVHDAVFMVDGSVYRRVPTGFGQAINKPEDPKKSGYFFIGWDPGLPPTMPNQEVVFNALFYYTGIFDLELLPKTGSSTVFGENNIIYGLQPGLSTTAFEANYVTINGNGRLQYTFIAGSFGTGTKVELIDNTTNTVMETYYIVIFGDLNGDGSVDSNDSGLIIDYENWLVEWDPVEDKVFLMAGDINGDGTVGAVDADLLVEIENWIMYIDQVTGLAVFY